MKLPQASIRDLFWLVLVAALGLGWWLDRGKLATEIARLNESSFMRFPGQVTAVDHARGLVEIGLGSDDGLTSGDIVEFQRSDGTVGRLVITQFNYDESVAKEQETGDIVDVRKGDEVTVKIRRDVWSSRVRGFEWKQSWD